MKHIVMPCAVAYCHGHPLNDTSMILSFFETLPTLLKTGFRSSMDTCWSLIFRKVILPTPPFYTEYRRRKKRTAIVTCPTRCNHEDAQIFSSNAGVPAPTPTPPHPTPPPSVLSYLGCERRQRLREIGYKPRRRSANRMPKVFRALTRKWSLGWRSNYPRSWTGSATGSRSSRRRLWRWSGKQTRTR